MIERFAYECLYCDHAWTGTLNKKPVNCPVCRRRGFDEPLRDARESYPFKNMEIGQQEIIEIKQDDYARIHRVKLALSQHGKRTGKNFSFEFTDGIFKVVRHS